MCSNAIRRRRITSIVVGITWRRRGAPQVPHPHFLMGGLRNLIYAHHPKLVDALLEAGVWELPFIDTLHPVARSRTTGRAPATHSSPHLSAVVPRSKR